MKFANIPEYLWAPFGYIVEVIDKTGKYTSDLTHKERERLGEQITRIITANDVYDEERDAKRFLGALAGMIAIWTFNTKGKDPDEIHRFK